MVLLSCFWTLLEKLVLLELVVFLEKSGGIWFFHFCLNSTWKTRNCFLQINNILTWGIVSRFGFVGDQVAGAHRSLARIYSEAIRPRFQHDLPSSVWQKREESEERFGLVRSLRTVVRAWTIRRVRRTLSCSFRTAWIWLHERWLNRLRSDPAKKY